MREKARKHSRKKIVEPLLHAKLRQYAHDLLLEKGFKPSEIHDEYLIFNENKRRVDVVGISQSKRVAIECGHTSPEKLDLLKETFDEAINLKALTIIILLEEENEKLRKMLGRQPIKQGRLTVINVNEKKK